MAASQPCADIREHEQHISSHRACYANTILGAINILLFWDPEIATILLVSLVLSAVWEQHECRSAPGKIMSRP